MYRKPNRKPILYFFVVLLIIAASGAYLVFRGSSQEPAKSEDTVVSASSVSLEDAPFEHVFPEKMDGLFLVGETYDGEIYEARYSDGENEGFIRKSVGSGDNSGVTNSFPEKSEHDIDGVTVTFRGRNGKVNLATWENSNIIYSIGIRVDGEGAASEDMLEYVKELR